MAVVKIFTLTVLVMAAFFASYVILDKFLFWLLAEKMEFKFVPFKWREGNYALVALPGFTAFVIWASLWITVAILFLQ